MNENQRYILDINHLVPWYFMEIVKLDEIIDKMINEFLCIIFLITGLFIPVFLFYFFLAACFALKLQHTVSDLHTFNQINQRNSRFQSLKNI